MSVEVVLENIGGLSGSYTFKFVKGAVNIVRASNAAGKTALIKAITSCLSAPYRSKTAIEFAREMGLLKQPSEAIEPLIHIGANAAKVMVKVDDEEWKYTLLKNGEYTYTREGDERFLITSVIVRDSKIIRKLMSGDTDFKQIIELVSLADRYEMAATILEEEKLRTEDILEQVKRKKRNMESLREKEKKLLESINKHSHEENLLNQRLSELLERKPEINKLRKQRDELLSKIREQETLIEEIRKRMGRLRRQIDDETEKHEAELYRKAILEKESKKLVEEIKNKEERVKILTKLLKNHEERIREISGQVEVLRVEEGRLLDRLELYRRALGLATQTREVRCFLCGQGYLKAEDLEQQKLLTEKQLNEIRDKISQLISERNNIYSALREMDDIASQLKELRKKLTEITGELQGLDEALASYAMQIDPLRRDLDSLEAEFMRVQQTRKKYGAELDAIEKSIRDIGREEQEVIEKLSEVRARLEELKKQLDDVIRSLEPESRIEILGYKLPLEFAERVLTMWSATIEETLKEVRVEARKERVAAIDLFNSQIKEVLRDFRFEYLDVWISASDCKLHIIDKRTGNEVTPRILSETEKYTLALAIHIALKLAYTPHVPFFLIDEVVLSFDEARREAALKYLYNLAKENNWCVLITELSQEPEMAINILIDP